jgi:hypothetical protein
MLEVPTQQSHSLIFTEYQTPTALCLDPIVVQGDYNGGNYIDVLRGGEGMLKERLVATVRWIEAATVHNDAVDSAALESWLDICYAMVEYLRLTGGRRLVVMTMCNVPAKVCHSGKRNRKGSLKV